MDEDEAKKATKEALERASGREWYWLGRGTADVGRPLTSDQLAKGFIRPIKRWYMHNVCGTITSMSNEQAEKFARVPQAFRDTYCVQCQENRPVDEFIWVDDGSQVGS